MMIPFESLSKDDQEKYHRAMNNEPTLNYNNEVVEFKLNTKEQTTEEFISELALKYASSEYLQNPTNQEHYCWIAFVKDYESEDEMKIKLGVDFNLDKTYVKLHKQYHILDFKAYFIGNLDVCKFVNSYTISDLKLFSGYEVINKKTDSITFRF